MQKAKKEDFRVEEELRSQKAKYEETNEDVYRRMQDIKEAEADSIVDLTAFLDAELGYYDRCRELLVSLKREWPAVYDICDFSIAHVANLWFRQTDPNSRDGRKLTRSRSNTAHSYAERYNTVEEEPEMPPPERPSIRSNRAVSSNYVSESPKKEPQAYDYGTARPGFNRSTTFEGPTQLYRDSSPVSAQRMTRVPSDSLSMRTQRAQLKPLSRVASGNDAYDDPSDTSTFYSNSTSSPDRYFGDRAASPATSLGSAPSRNASSSTLNGMSTNTKKAPPPPPPSRAKKPPPPPPPMKRSALSTSDVHYA